jgi:hypothetical protein
MYKPVLISFFFLSVALEQSLGQTHAQTATLFKNPAGGKTIGVAFGSPCTSGNLIIAHVDWDGQTRNVATLTDSKGNIYHKISGTTDWNTTNYAAELWYAYNIHPGATTVTATLSGNPTSFLQIYISEYSGIAGSIDPLDQSSVAIGNSIAVSSGTAATRYTNELVYGASIGASGALTTGAGFVNRSTANSNIIEDKNVTTGGSFGASFTSAGGNWVAQMATFISTISLLPVDFISFAGHCENNQTVLEWTTASETNNDNFIIEQSGGGNDWKAIGAVKGAGNSSMAKEYSFNVVAGETNKGIVYFRIKQTDVDGHFIYSRIIGVNSCSLPGSTINIFPNPSNGTSLSGTIGYLPEGKYSIEFFDSFGRIAGRSMVTQAAFTINFPQTLPAGVYYARFSSEGLSTVLPFLVKH